MINTPAQVEELTRQDQAHIIHPLYHPDEHARPMIFVEGQGAVIKDIEGNEYIDGLSSLWNVNIGHGRTELADVAACGRIGKATPLRSVERPRLLELAAGAGFTAAESKAVRGICKRNREADRERLHTPEVQ